MEFEPLRVLELCAGMSGSYGILIDLGFSIEIWDAVEMDSEMASVAMKAYPQLRHAGERVELFQVGKVPSSIGRAPLAALEPCRCQVCKGFQG